MKWIYLDFCKWKPGLSLNIVQEQKKKITVLSTKRSSINYVIVLPCSDVINLVFFRTSPSPLEHYVRSLNKMASNEFNGSLHLTVLSVSRISYFFRVKFYLNSPIVQIKPRSISIEKRMYFHSFLVAKIKKTHV